MTLRDDVRTRLALLSNRAKELGLNVDDIRKETRSEQAVTAQILRLSNTPTPTEGHERLGWDDFAGQTYDGTNQDFTLSHKVLGENIMGWRFIQALNVVAPLAKTTNPAPSGLQFYFDHEFTVRVGTPPASLDGLIFAYVKSP